jgi:hypothetical protein
VPAGRHLVRVEASGHRPYQRIVVLAPAESLAVDAPLESDGSRSVLEEPAFWIVTIAILSGAGAGVGIGVALTQPQAPYGGDAGFTVTGLAF